MQSSKLQFKIQNYLFSTVRLTLDAVHSQRGIAPVLVVILLLAGLAIGVYLSQQKTNILPQAAGKTVACDGQTLSGQSEQSRADFSAVYGDRAAEAWVEEHEKELKDKGIGCNGGGSGSGSFPSKPVCQDDPPGAQRPANFYWKADCSKTCVKNSDCPISDDPSVNKDTSNQCFEFKEGNRCLKLTSKQGTSAKDFVDYGNNPGSPSGGGGQTQSCTQAQDTYYKTKVATRYALYRAIMEGVPETCVKADLGVLETADTPALKGKTKDGSKEGRLYLCSGANSKKDNLDLVWRIDTGDGQLQETDKGTPDPNNLLNKNHVKKAEEILGTTTSGTSTNTNTNTVSVNISNSKYSPSEVTINSGDTVTWTNKDSIAHTVTANNGNFDSRNIGPGESFSYKFTSSGSFSYFCKIHPDMKGVVTVK